MRMDAIEPAQSKFNRNGSRPARERAAKSLSQLRRQAAEMAASAQDAAKDLAEATQDRARDLMGAARGRARGAAGAARERARARIEDRRGAAADALEEVAERLRPRTARAAQKASMVSRSTLLLAGALGLGVALGMMVNNQLRARRARKQTIEAEVGAAGKSKSEQLTQGQRLEGQRQEGDGFARSVAASPTTTPFT